MAQINPYDIHLGTTCYAAVTSNPGFICGKLQGWKLYDLKNPALCRPLSQSPSEILAAFDTQEELEQWLEDLYKEPELKSSGTPTLSDNVKYISKGDPDKGNPPFILSQVL